MMDEFAFANSPGHVIPGKVGQAMSSIAAKLRDHADDKHPNRAEGGRS